MMKHYTLPKNWKTKPKIYIALKPKTVKAGFWRVEKYEQDFMTLFKKSSGGVSEVLTAT